MGLTYDDAHSLVSAGRRGVDFTTVATIGRQSLYLRRADLARMAAEFALESDGRWTRQPFGGPAEPFFREVLGAREVVTIDASAYQGAQVIHDMNLPVPRDQYERYDALLDGGSLEHIFNVPVALANMMRMVKTGGSVFISTPANNLCGHGFYQFSPELMFRVFAPEHGFAIRELLLFDYPFPSIELASRHRAYRVVDPARAGERVGLVSRRVAIMFAWAEKLNHLDDPLLSAPQQSDYVAAWRSPRSRVRADVLPVALRPAARRVNAILRATRAGGFVVGRRRRLKMSLRNRSHYSRVR